MVTIELADHKGVWLVEPGQRDGWAQTLAEQHLRQNAARLDFKSAGQGLQRIMRMEGFCDLREGGGWEPLENGDAKFMLLDGTWRYVTAEELRDAIKRGERTRDRRQRWLNIDDLEV